MGDRANIVIVDYETNLSGENAVFLYTHWTGSELPEALKAGLEKGRDRWTDAQYLARVLFQQMLGSDTGTTGYGITATLGDNSYPLLIVDVPRQVIVEYPEDTYREKGFAELPDYHGSPFAKYSGRWKTRE